jgi:RsiW-degrading membrane proteinase PrsW (M82 family)
MIIVIELLVIFTAIIAFSIYIAGRPDLAAQIESLAQRLPFAIDSQARLSKMLEPYLRSPILIVSVLGFIAVIVPVIEETLKPIGVWLLVGRNLTAAEGFVAGAISGAGYALFENLFIPNSGVGWAAVALGRMGTAAMHILASALTGWGLALAWREGKYLRLGLQYLAAIALHSTWYATTVINAGVNLLPQTPTLIVTAQALTYAMGILALSIFILIIFFSRRLAVVAPPPDSDLQATNSLS